MSSHTLDIKRPFGQTLILALLILSLIMGAGEITVRQQKVQAYLAVPSMDTRHKLLNRQWHRLETLTKSGVQIQCIALGNSMVLNGFDPQIFSQNFTIQSAREINCFNFGVDGLTPISAAALARILIETYHPQLLIFGTDARDYAVAPDAQEATVIMDMDWIQYRLGNFNIPGWLVDHSYLYRYRYSLADLLSLTINRTREPITNQYGFEPFETIFPVTIPPDPNDSSYHVQYYFRVLDNYAVRPENQAALVHILEKQDPDTTIVVVEMPVPDTYFYFFSDPLEDYNRFMHSIRTVTTEHQVLLFQTTTLHLIPDDGWMDYSHVNRKGSVLFSEWLGQQLGKAARDGKIGAFGP